MSEKDDQSTEVQLTEENYAYVKDMADAEGITPEEYLDRMLRTNLDVPVGEVSDLIDSGNYALSVDLPEHEFRVGESLGYSILPGEYMMGPDGTMRVRIRVENPARLKGREVVGTLVPLEQMAGGGNILSALLAPEDAEA